jgi:hypothetical protein
VRLSRRRDKVDPLRSGYDGPTWEPGLPWAAGPSLLGVEPLARDSNATVVQESVEQCASEPRIGEDLAPVGEVLIARSNRRAPLIAQADQLEQPGRCGLVEFDVSYSNASKPICSLTSSRRATSGPPSRSRQT